MSCIVVYVMNVNRSSLNRKRAYFFNPGFHAGGQNFDWTNDLLIWHSFYTLLNVTEVWDKGLSACRNNSGIPLTAFVSNILFMWFKTLTTSPARNLRVLSLSLLIYLALNIYIEEYSKDSFNFLCAAASVCPCYWDDTGLLIWIWLFDIYVIAEINTLTEWLSTALKNQTIRTFEKQEDRVVNLRASARPVPVYSSNLYYCSRIK